MSKAAEKQTPETEADALSKRIADIRERRKMRGSKDQAGYKLSVNQDALDKRYQMRWVNEENLSFRSAEATFGGDYEMVPNKDGKYTDGRNLEEKTTIARCVEGVVGKKAYLMRKPIELWQDDYNQRLEKIARIEGQMKQEGVARGPDSLLDAEDGSLSYKPAQVARAYKR